MNVLGLQLVWVALQVTAFCLAAIALYLVARRRNPASGAWLAGAALAMTVLFTALALSPWPHWWSLETAAETAPTEAAPPEPAEFAAIEDAAQQRTGLAPGMISGPYERTAEKQPAAAAPAQASNWRTTMSKLSREVSSNSPAHSTSDWKWPAWLTVILAAGCVVALLRLLIAVVAAERYRRLARPLFDPLLEGTLQDVCRDIGCTRTIELRQSPASARRPRWAGTGPPLFCRPIGPPGAATNSGPFSRMRSRMWPAATSPRRSWREFGVALHFYNPLVHWLGRRLRLEQELAADVWGARVLGSSERYLVTLADMALRANDRPLQWAVHPFLPTRGTLMRRVEMLHRRKSLPSLSLSRLGRGLSALVLVALGSLIVGLRAPIVAQQAVQAAPPAAATASPAAFNLDYIPDNAVYALALRPAELVRLKSLDSLEGALQKLGLFEMVDLPPAEIEEFKFIAAGDLGQGGWAVAVLRSKKPHDWNPQGTKWTGEVAKKLIAGQECYVAVEPKPHSPLTAYWLPDDRTIVVTSAEHIGNTFSLRGNVNEPEWAAQWKAVADKPALLMLRTDLLQVMLGNVGIAENRPVIFAGAERDGVFFVDGRLEMPSAEAAAQAGGELQGALASTREHILAAAKRDNPVSSLPTGMLQIMTSLIDVTRVAAREKVVYSRSTLAEQFGKDLSAAVDPARAAARRNQSANKMKQLGIAMQNYHDTFKRLPSASVMGPDGKTPHSWRVELLPFLEGPRDL